MAENNQPKTKISGQERFHLDTYGYAQLGLENPNAQLPAMQEMYSAFIDEHDPIISRTLQEANMAKMQITAKERYDATPEDQRGDAKDPGNVDERLAKSLQTVGQAGLMYTIKRSEMQEGLTTHQALDYHSRQDGRLAIDAPENVVNLIRSTSKKIGELGDEGTDAAIRNALGTIDNYKIHGDINSRVQRGIARRSLEAISAGLENSQENQE